MPLLGKIVVIKRNGADGTEFPLTASCLFGRKLDCDIRIQMPQVSKEHCRIEMNENKELILTNLSSVNPTRINGDILQQSERLKHGDIITIIDRSFRFEYPPPPTPKKKRLSTSEKGETVKVLQDQQVRSTPGPKDKKKSEHSDNCLKDGSNLPSSLDQSIESTKGDDGLQGKPNTDGTMSPFSELYHMVKQDLASKSPWKAAAHPKSPISRPQDNKGTPKKLIGSENDKPATPKSVKKNRRSSTAKAVGSSDSDAAEISKTEDSVESPPVGVQAATPAVQDTPGKQKRRSSSSIAPTLSEASSTPVSQKKTPQVTPQRFTANEVAEQILLVHSSAVETPKSLKGRSVASQPQSQGMTPKSRTSPQTSSSPKTPITSKSQTPISQPEESEAKQTLRTSPRANAVKKFQVQDVVHELVTTPASDDKNIGRASSRKHKCDDLHVPVPKRKRVSFGGQLSPELFDKRLPPNSPLRRGATPGRRSLGIPQKPQSLLRRASTIGLMVFQLDDTVPERPSKNASPKSLKASPAKTTSAKKSSSTKCKTPSPKNQKTPPKTPASPSVPATPKTPKSAKRVSNSSLMTPLASDGSVIQTPTVRGRFSITQITTPSPDKEVVKDFDSAVEVSRECVTPKISCRRSSMKASARKTPKSALKSAFEVMRSRRSGASRANLKVVGSWADIVKFGQIKPQVECGTKKTATKQKAAKQAKTVKSKTPARRLKNDTSTGHADSPATIVIGKAYLRATQPVGAAPKIVSNVALFKKDMKMDEDLTGVADIFKTPANRKQSLTDGEYPETPLGFPVSSLTEMSVMNTPEESGEMVVSPMSVASTAKLGRYNSEAVTRLLQDNQEAGAINEDGSQMDDSNNLPANAEEETGPQMMVQTPQPKPAPLECLTGVKKLMRTPKQRPEPIGGLRGKLLKTPKGPKPTQEENFEGVKELLNTPKQKETPVLMETPNVKSSPVVCAAALKKNMKTRKDKAELEEDLTGVKQLMQTPKLKGNPAENAFGVKRLTTPKQKGKSVEEDFTGIQQMMKTPKQKNEPVEEDLTGIQQMMKTPIQKNKPVEDLTGLQQKMKTPKQKNKPVEDLTGLQEMKPKQKNEPVKEDLTGIQQMMKTPKQKNKPVEDLTGLQQKMKTPKQKNKPVEEDLTGLQEMKPKQKNEPVEDLPGIQQKAKTPKQKNKPVEDLTGIQQMMKTPKQKNTPIEEDLTGIQQMMKTPKQKNTPIEEDLTGIQQMMKTPKQKNEPIEDLPGIQQKAKTPKQKNKPVEDLTGIQQMMKTPKQKNTPIEEDLTGIQQMMKTPKQKNTPIEEDLTGIQHMMKTPKQKNTPIEEDLTGIQQMMKTPKQKNTPIEEDLTGIQQMMKTPKQENEPVEDLTGIQQKPKTPKQKNKPVEDLTGIQQMMKTPKQKNTPIEDLTGIQQMMKTPKQKNKPVEEDLTGLQQMMKTPKQKRQPVEDLSGVERLLQTPKEKGRLVDNEVDVAEVAQNDTNESAENTLQETLTSVASDLAVEGANEGSEDKENVCPVESIENETQEAIQNVPQIEMADVAITGQEEKRMSPIKVICSEQPVQVVSLAVDVSQSLPAPKKDEKAKNSSLAKKTQCGGRVKTTRESKTTDSVSPVQTEREEQNTVVETVLPLCAPLKGRRGKHIIEDPVPVPNPVRKSSRGRIPKCQIKDKEDDHTEGLRTSQDVEQVSKCPSIPVKPRRGRKVEPGVSQMNVAESKSESSGEVAASLESLAPATKGTRGQKDNHVSENSLVISPPQEPHKAKIPEAADKDVQESAELDAPVKTNTRTRRGRLPKKETQKNTQDQEMTKPASDIVELGVISCDVLVTEEPQMSVRPGRGRRAKPGASKDLRVVDEPKTDAEAVPVESGQKPVRSTVKSKNLRTEGREIADDQPVTAEVPESVEHVGPVVKNVRGGRRTRQPKAAQPGVQENVDDKSEVNGDVVEQSEVPVKLVRGRRAVIEDEPEAPLKKGRRAAVAAVPPPVVKSIRGRKAVVKAEQKEVAEEPATDIKLPLSDPVETVVSQASSEGVVNAEDGARVVPNKRGRGRCTKKEKISTTENSVKVENTTVKQSEAGVGNKRKTFKKAVNWNSDLVTWKNIEELVPPAAEEEPQKMSNKEEPKAPATEELSISENNQSAEPPVKGRRGRVAKKQNEPLTETTAENDAPVVRRGRAGASLVSKSDEVPACPKRGTKRKGIDDAADTTVESLPKRTKGKAASAEAQTEVAAPSKRRKATAKEVPEESHLAEAEANEPASKKEGNKPVRGKRKAAQEVDSVPAPREDPGSEPSTRRGTRGQKKSEAETPSAPVRRTRRK